MGFFNWIWPFKRNDNVSNNTSQPTLSDFLDEMSKEILRDIDNEIESKESEYTYLVDNKKNDLIITCRLDILTLQYRRESCLYNVAKRHAKELPYAEIDAIKTKMDEIENEMRRLTNSQRATPDDGIPQRMFKIGDTVVLKSGGPNMTVVNIKFSSGLMGMNPAYIMCCQWFDNKNNRLEGEFNQNLLISQERSY